MNSLNVTPCDKEPCTFTRGETTTVELDFVSNVSVTGCPHILRTVLPVVFKRGVDINDVPTHGKVRSGPVPVRHLGPRQTVRSRSSPERSVQGRSIPIKINKSKICCLPYKIMVKMNCIVSTHSQKQEKEISTPSTQNLDPVHLIKQQVPQPYLYLHLSQMWHLQWDLDQNYLLRRTIPNHERYWLQSNSSNDNLYIWLQKFLVLQGWHDRLRENTLFCTGFLRKVRRNREKSWKKMHR